MPQLNRCPQGTIIKFNRCDGTDAQDGDKFVRCDELPLFATSAETIAGTATDLIVNPADLFARENISAQTGLSNDVTAISAPTASQSVWGVNQLGETLHYAPGLGWQIVGKRYHLTSTNTTNTPLNGWTPVRTLIVPRAGVVSLSSFAAIIGNAAGDRIIADATSVIAVNGAVAAFGSAFYSNTNWSLSSGIGQFTSVANVAAVSVLAGDVVTLLAMVNRTTAGGGGSTGFVVGNAGSLTFAYQE